MRLTKKRIFGGALAFAAAFALSAGAFAQQGGGAGPHPFGGGGRHGGPCGPGGHGGSLVEHLDHVLTLTDAQKAQVKQIEVGFRESTKSLHEQLPKAGPGGGPFEGLADGAFDEAAVRAAAQQRANLHVEMEVAHAKMMSQVYAVLTAEQRAKVTELKKHFEGHRPPPPPPGGEEGAPF